MGLISHNTVFGSRAKNQVGGKKGQAIRLIQDGVGRNSIQKFDSSCNIGQNRQINVFKLIRLNTSQSFIMSIAILLFSSPHFFLDDYSPLDNNDSNFTTEGDPLTSKNSSQWAALLVMMSLVASGAFLPIYTTGTCRSVILLARTLKTKLRINP